MLCRIRRKEFRACINVGPFELSWSTIHLHLDPQIGEGMVAPICGLRSFTPSMISEVILNVEVPLCSLFRHNG